jgi:hypothetical protein
MYKYKNYLTSFFREKMTQKLKREVLMKDYIMLLLVVLVLGLFNPIIALAQSESDNFQFDELDFDRQTPTTKAPGSTAPKSGPPPVPTVGTGQTSDDPDGLITLFEGTDTTATVVPGNSYGQAGVVDGYQDQNAPDAALYNLPGEPSPVAVPSAPGEAKIERSTPPVKVTARPPAVARIPKTPPTGPRNRNRWFYASEAWRGSHLESGCNSISSNSQLYNVSCLGRINGGQGGSTYYSGQTAGVDGYVAVGLKDIRLFP